MSKLAPENNMALIANAGELAALTIGSMMTNEHVRDMFTSPAARTTVYNAVNAALAKRLAGKIRDIPTGQFNKSVMVGGHASGAQVPNVSA